MNASHCFKPASEPLAESVVCELCERCRTVNASRKCDYCQTLPVKPTQPTFADVYKRACDLFPNETVCLHAEAWAYRYTTATTVREAMKWTLSRLSDAIGCEQIHGDSLAELLEKIERAAAAAPTQEEQLASVVMP